MKGCRKLFKKAFTLVELVVVVAIIAILSGVCVAAYQGLTDKANRASDQETLSQLNIALAANEAGDSKNTTCYDAIKEAYEVGINMETLKPSTRNAQYVWDQDNDRFAIIDEDHDVIAEDSTYKLTSNQNHIWIFSDTYEVNYYKNSVYLKSSCTQSEITNVTTGIDTGINNELKTITYGEPTSTPNGDVVIRTNLINITLNIDATSSVLTNATIQHYGICGDVKVHTVSTNNYIENGTVAKLVITEGHASIAKSATVFSVEHPDGVQTSVEIDYSATVYDYLGYESDDIEANFNSDADGSYIGFTYRVASVSCCHTTFSNITDDFGTYCICHRCGYALVNHCIPEWNSYTKLCVEYVDSDDNFSDLKPTLKTEDIPSSWYRNDNAIETNNSDLAAAYTSESIEMSEEQHYCSHSNYKYESVDSFFHKCTCEDCGYSFIDTHDHGVSCESCHTLKHSPSADHKKDTLNEAGSFYFSKTYFDEVNVEVLVSNDVIYVWGFNGNARGTTGLSLDSAITLQNILLELPDAEEETSQTLVQNQTYLFCVTPLTVVFMDCTFVPSYFLTVQNYNGNYYANFSIVDIVLPDTLVQLGYACFACLWGIKSVSLPNSLTTIGISAFSFTGITSITIPSRVTEIPSYTFSQCQYLSEVYIPEGVTKLGYSSFNSANVSVLAYKMHSLKSLTIPSTVTHVGYQLIDTTYTTDLRFNGTVAQWRNVKYLGSGGSVSSATWFSDSSIVVHCIDGDAAKL